MNVKHFLAAAVIAAAGPAFAGQGEFVQPDAGFTSSLSRAEVRQQMLEAYGNRRMVQQQVTGQDPVYAKGQRSRAEVRAELEDATRRIHAGDVTNPYFG